MASAFIGKLKSKKGHEATIVRSKNIEDGTLRYSLYKHAKVSYSYGRKLSYVHTMWEFHDFSITQILHEINFGDSRSARSAISSHLEALNCDFY